MPYTLKYNPSLGVVELTGSGAVTAAELSEATTACITLGKQNGTVKFLVDASGMESGPSVIDFFNLPVKQYVDEDVSPHSLIAVILPVSKKAGEAVHFYETACQNRGWLVKIVQDRQSAIDWFTGK